MTPMNYLRTLVGAEPEPPPVEPPVPPVPGTFSPPPPPVVYEQPPPMDPTWMVPGLFAGPTSEAGGGSFVPDAGPGMASVRPAYNPFMPDFG